jgi:methionyl aminopeptidase
MNLPVKELNAIFSGLIPQVKAGMMLLEIDALAGELMKQQGVKSADLGYKPAWANTPFPNNMCLSVNDCIAHGIPTEYRLREGDWVNLDIGIEKDGLFADAAITVPIGEQENKHDRLLRNAVKTLYAGIDEVRAGITTRELGRVISTYALRMGYVVNRTFTGHTIGEQMHAGVSIPHFWEVNEKYDKTYSYVLKEGDIICLEPMLTFKDPDGYLHKNGWAWLTRDGKRSAMFEHMIEVTKDGGVVLTNHFDRTAFTY